MDRRHAGTLFHRLWTCPVLEPERRKHVPGWLRAEVRQAIQPDGTMAAADLLLFTRALAPSLEAELDPEPTEESFEWVVPPTDSDGGVIGKFYVDGSMLDADWRLAGCCARRGWAFAAVDSLGEVVASARGRPPAWTGGINGAELWGLLMAAQAAFPGSPFRVDCQAVQLGTRRGVKWATAPKRQLARAWGPLASLLEDASESVVWMPAHCTAKDVGYKELGDGSKLSSIDWRTNDLVDRLAKSAAHADRVPQAQRQRVQSLWDRVTAIATWIVHDTALANHSPALLGGAASKMCHIRDNEGQQRRGTRRARQKTPQSSCQRCMAAVVSQRGKLCTIALLRSRRWQSIVQAGASDLCWGRHRSQQ